MVEQCITNAHRKTSDTSNSEFLRHYDCSCQFAPGAIAALYAHSHSGTITQADRYGLLAALSTAWLSDEEIQSLDRLLPVFSRGRLHVVDDISSLS